LELCPVCSESVGKLTHCTGCIYEDRGAASRAQCRLDAYRRTAGDNAYLPSGCRVCAQCARQFGKRSNQCPLVIFYQGLTGVAVRTEERRGLRAVEEAIDYWTACLKERDFPEHVEGFWRRMVDWLIYEVRRR
jgi:hypothetical protein